MSHENDTCQHEQPIVVVSQCLGFAAVRYNGAMLEDDYVQALRQHVKFVQVCPEIGIGLGVPRAPIRIVSGRNGRRLVQPSTGLDLSEQMRQFAADFLKQLGPVDGFILKSRSPSCGIKDVKTFADAETAMPMQKSSGFFAEVVMSHHPQAAIEDEGRLTNFRLRHHFLVKLYALAALRQARQAGTISGLVRFQTLYKLQWMAYSQTGLTQLGRIAANKEKLPVAEVFAQYADRLARMLGQPTRASGERNALLHAFGYVSKKLSPAERKHFLKMLEEYREQRLPLSALLTLLQSWVVRFEQDYLLGQKFFEPYPRELMDLRDSAEAKKQNH